MNFRNSIHRFLVCTLVAGVLAGCDRQPAGTPAAFSTNVVAPTTNGTLADPSAGASAGSKSVPLRTILSLKPDGQPEETPAEVRVRGTVLDARPGEYIVVHDDTGTVFAETHQASLPRAKAQVEVQGEPASDGFSVTLKNAVVTPLTRDGSTNGGESTLAIKPARLPLLKKVWEIRDLTAEKAAWHYPVRLRAVVTVNTKIGKYFFAQDDSAGISVLMTEIRTNLNPGDQVRIEGVSDPGGFSPIVLASNVTVTGTAALPEAQPETLFQLASGQDGSQWIEVRGVVRSLTYSNGLAQLNLNDLSGMLVVNVPAEREPDYLLDATVRIQGACGSKPNDKRQFAGFEMWVSSLGNVEIEEPAAPDPLNRPAQPIANLGQFHPRQTLQHRVNIAGVVTVAGPDSFFVQDADDGVQVLTRVQGGLRPGDYVMAVGYPSPGPFGHVLRDAVFKVISHRQIPAPLLLTAEDSLDPQWHDRWVRLDARFLHRTRVETGDVLTLQIGDRVFEAHCQEPVTDRISGLAAGSLLQVTGLYRVLADEARQPISFQLTVPAELDLQVLEEPSWWTIKHAATLVGLMAAIIGATILWVVMLRRKVQAQTASLQKSEHQFRSLVEQSLVGVYIVQAERFVYVNPRMAAIFGYTVVEMVGTRRLDELILSEDLPSVRNQICRRLDGEVDFAHYFFRGRRQDGAIIHAEMLGSRTEYGGQPAMLGMLLDVSERKLAQDKIAEQARLLDLAGDAIIVCDLSDRILYWNQSAQQIYGWTASEAVGGMAFEKMRVNAADFQKAKSTLLKEHTWRGEFTHRDPQAGEITVAARWTLVHDPQGKPDSILAINTDITQQKKLEAQFLRTQRLESIGVLAGGIAHDLNNVFAPILMSCHLLEIDPEAPERRELLDNILTSTQRAANLVKQILTFARGTDGRRLAIQPRYLIEELRKMLRETLPKSIHLQIRVDPETLMITADATQLHQVLMNLCINARDAMPQGGELTITVANVELDEPAAATNGEAKPGPYVCFSVTDTGTGMTPQIRERIFDPFFTTKEVGKGTGLGLSTTLGIVKSHGGFIQVSSEPNQGSCFKVYLPAQTTGPASAENPDPDALVVRGNNELILLVDDEASVRTIATQTLKMFGYRVITANDGTEAIARYVEQKDEIALVLLDMLMPILDGQATIHALARINPGVKIIAASGLTNENQTAGNSSPTVRAFLPKPYTAQIMLKTIQEVLHPQPGTGQIAA